MTTHDATLAPTISVGDARALDWDVVVIGAGPAGALSAKLLAERGLGVLLIDKLNFPRPKVCGSCIGHAGVAALETAGLGSLLDELGAPRIETLTLGWRRRRVDLPIMPGRAVSRDALDAALIRRAIAAGAAFLPAVGGVVRPGGGGRREVLLNGSGFEQLVRARAVLAADGLAATSLRELPEFECHVSPTARIGASLRVASAPGIRPNTIHMHVSPRGYVGLALLEDGSADIGAALDAPLVRAAGGLSEAMATILEDSGHPAAKVVRTARSRGTPPLTRFRRPLAHDRVFLLGDAAGYVEPFTGEGITWAAQSAIALAPIVERAVRDWTPALAAEWARTHGRLFGSRAVGCRTLATLLRWPIAVSAAVSVLRIVPGLAQPYIRHVARRTA